MSLSFQVMPAAGDAKSTAVTTRNKLAEFIAGLKEGTADAVVQELSKGEIRELRAQGSKMFLDAYSGEQHLARPDRIKLINGLTAGLDRMEDTYETEDWRKLSYLFEGVVKAYNANLHATKCKVDDLFKATLGLAMFREYHPGHVANWLNDQDLLHRPLRYWPFATCVEEAQLNQYVLYKWGNDGQADRDARETINTGALAGVTAGDWRGVGRPVQLLHCRPVLLAYNDVDGPWIAGFASADDTMRGRFTRCTLGSWLSARGVPDEEVKQTVERAKAANAAGSFELYPNDILFGELYEEAGRDGNTSCMAADRDEYGSDGHHPTDVYSSAHFGTGDNGLVLVVERKAGESLGRGILNVGTMQIVRWYGSVTGERAMRKAGIKKTYDALKGSWLSLVQPSGEKSRRVVAPYVDGNYQGARADFAERRVYFIKAEGDTLCETNGYVDLDAAYCVDTGEMESRDTAVYQSEHNNWISSELEDKWRCPVINEWCDDGDRVGILLDGKPVEVCQRVGRDRISQYLREIPAPTDVEEGWENEINYTGKSPFLTAPAEPIKDTPAPPVVERRPTQFFSWDEVSVAQAAAPAPVVLGDEFDPLSSYAQPRQAVLAADFSELEARVAGLGRSPDEPVIQSLPIHGCTCAYCQAMRGRA